MGIVRPGELLAAIGGIALLVVSTLDWYGTRSAWEAFAVLDVVLAIVALLAIALAVLNATRRSPSLPVAAAVLTFVVAAIAVLWVAFRLLDAPGPDGGGVASGAWLGLLCTLAVAVGSWISMRDESARRTPQPAVRMRPAPAASTGATAAAVATQPPAAAAPGAIEPPAGPREDPVAAPATVDASPAPGSGR